MPTYSCHFQHPDTGYSCVAKYGFGHVRFGVADPEDYLLDHEDGEEQERDRAKLNKSADETEKLIVEAVGRGRIRARSLDEAEEIVKKVARDQYDYGLEED